MMENEIERCAVVEYRRVAASNTGVPRASPTARGRTPQASANDGLVVVTITLRAMVQMPTPRKKVRPNPIASVNEPATNVKIVIAGAQTQPTSAPAPWPLKPRPVEHTGTIG